MVQQRATQARRPGANQRLNAAVTQRPQSPMAGPAHPLLRLQHTIGNRAVQGLLQTKLTIGPPGDVYEQEADRVAEQIVSSPGVAGSTRLVAPQRIQRKCAACASGHGQCAKCAAEEELQRKPLTSPITPLIQRQSNEPLEEEEEEQPLQTKASSTSSPKAPPNRAAHLKAIKGGGQPLPAVTRTFFEPRFGYDFSQVRLHTDARAAQAAQAVNARAFTIGQDVVFGPGQYAPETDQGQRLLAHELTHVVQQSSLLSPTTSTLQRQAAPTSAAAETAPETVEAVASPGLIVEDTAPDLKPGQMKKSEFLAKLRAEVCKTAEAALAGTGQTTQGCPYLSRWFDYYRDKDSQHIERAIHKYVPETARATTARQYIPIVAERVRHGVERWAETGKITDVPEDLLKAMPGAGLMGALGSLTSGIGGAVSSLVGGLGRGLSALGGVFFKGREGGAREVGNPKVIQGQLGPGSSLDSRVKGQMGAAFGVDFSKVRVHTDATAQALSDQFNARAFTIGNDIAFGAGQYQPGTLIGDALIAHELAHVVQQNGGNSTTAPMPKGETEYSSLEQDADVATVRAVASVWGRQGSLVNIGQKVMPRLRSGLRLSLGKCGSGSATPKTPTAKTPVTTESPLKERTEEPPKAYFTADDTAKAILAAAKDETVDKKIRAVRAVEQIIANYYSPHKEKVTKVVYDDKVEVGLEVKPILGVDKKTYYGEIYVGEGFLENISNGKRFPHEVLRVGHELEHIDQYRQGMAPPIQGKDQKKFEREFLAFYREGIAIEVPHTGRLWRPTRVHIIDCALRYYYCLKLDDQKKYIDYKDKLLKVRESEMKAINDPAKNFPESSKPPAAPPSSCTLSPGAQTCEPKEE